MADGHLGAAAVPVEARGIADGALANAELYLTLAHAFLPPRDAALAEAFREHLADDLEELAGALPGNPAGHIAGFRTCLAEVPDSLSLLQLYSRLFLAPPCLVHLNAGMYLDDGPRGKGLEAFERELGAHGMSRAAGFADLSDHISVQLEFLASLYALAAEAEPQAQAFLVGEARAFARDYLQPWSLPLAQRIAAACARHGLAMPYAHLAMLLAETLWEGEVLSAADASVPRETPEPPAVALEQQVCRVCRAGFLPSHEIAAMKRILAQRGLGVDHLDVCPDCRAVAMGLAALAPPEMPRGG